MAFSWSHQICPPFWESEYGNPIESVSLFVDKKKGNNTNKHIFIATVLYVNCKTSASVRNNNVLCKYCYC